MHAHNNHFNALVITSSPFSAGIGCVQSVYEILDARG